MPGAVGGLVAAIAGGVVASAVGGGILGAVLGGVTAAGLAYFLVDEPKSEEFDSLRQQGLRQNVQNPIAPIPVIYGEGRFGGHRVFVQTHSYKNKFLHLVLVWCEGEIEAIDNLYFDDVISTDSRFSGLTYISHHLGTDTQAADAKLVSYNLGWTNAHRLLGVAYTYVRLEYEATAFPRMPVITADIRGKKVYSVRTGSTAYSNNPADCIYDYMINTRYGRGFPTEEIDLASFQVAANACDVTINPGGSGAIAKYTCNGAVNTDRSWLANVKQLLTCCRAYLIFSGGLYKLRIDGAEASSFAFTEDNIVGEFSIALDSMKTRYNRLRAQFVDGARDYQPNVAIEDNSTYRAADNNTLLERKIDLPFTDSIYRARYIAQLELEQSRYSTTCQFTANLEGLRAEVGDVVTVTHSTPGWVLKTFRVLAIEYDSEETVRIRAREYANVYAPGTLPAEPTAPIVNIPPPNDVTDEMDFARTVSWLESFENGVDNWVEQGTSTVESDADARVGSLAGLFTNDGDVGSDAYITLDPNFWYTSTTPGHQVRVQFWFKQPSSNKSDNVRIEITNGTDSQTHDIVPTSSWQTDGFIFKPTVQGSYLRIYVYADRDGTSEAVLLDNLAAFIVPDFINTANISTWIDSLAVGEAYIANGAVTNAKIGTAAVDTLEVAGNAVSAPGSASATVTSCSGSWANTGAQVVVPAITNRQSIIIGVSVVQTEATITGCLGGIYFRITRDGTAIPPTGGDIAANVAGQYLGATFITIDQPSDASHTYRVQWRNGGGGSRTGGSVIFRMSVHEAYR